jgi:hypothetical protein
MFNRRTRVDAIEKFKTIRSIYDKIFITVVGSLWIFSTLWDIYKLQRYWLDYSIEFYSSFFIFNMIIFSINQKSLPTIIYNSFKIITTIRGRGITLLIISTLFLTDKHNFHKYCAILLFIGGILYLICEFLVPTTKEELNKIELIYNKKINSNKNVGGNIKNMQNKNGMNNSHYLTDKSTVIFNNADNNIKDNKEKKKVNVKEIKEHDNGDSKEIKEEINAGEKNDIEEKKKNDNNNDMGEEIIRKTDNPYEIPEDF